MVRYASQPFTPFIFTHSFIHSFLRYATIREWSEKESWKKKKKQQKNIFIIFWLNRDVAFWYVFVSSANGKREWDRTGTNARELLKIRNMNGWMGRSGWECVMNGGKLWIWNYDVGRGMVDEWANEMSARQPSEYRVRHDTFTSPALHTLGRRGVKEAEGKFWESENQRKTEQIVSIL